MEQRIERIGVENGGGVKKSAPLMTSAVSSCAKPGAKASQLVTRKGHAAERIDDVDQQEVEEEGGRRREGAEAKGEAFH